METLSTKGSISIKNKYSNELLPIVLVIADYIAIWLAEYISYGLRDFLVPETHFHLSWLSIHVIIPVVYILFLQLHHLYTRRMQFWQVISGLFKSVFYAVALLIFFIYIAQTAASTSRLFVALLWLTSFLFLIAERYLVKHILGHFKLLQLPVLIMGAGKTAAIVLDYFKHDTGVSYDFIGYLEDYTPEAKVAAMMPHLGRFEDAEDVIRQTGVQHVMVIAPGLSNDAVQDIASIASSLWSKKSPLSPIWAACRWRRSIRKASSTAISFPSVSATTWLSGTIGLLNASLISFVPAWGLSAFRRSFWPLLYGSIKTRPGLSSLSTAASAGTAKNSTAINSEACVSMPTSN